MKLLLIRLSSIGDIVLTSPVIRCLKKQLPKLELHVLVKVEYAFVLEANPYIDKLHLFRGSLSGTIKDLKTENFEGIVDLHNNQRSWLIKRALRVKSYSFNKLNIEKWLITKFKINKLPKVHIVDRYFETVKSLGVKNDGYGLDYFVPQRSNVDVNEKFPKLKGQKYLALVIGGTYTTKRLPLHKLLNLTELIDLPVIVLGSQQEYETGALIEKKCGQQVFNAAGKFKFNQSASIIQQAELVISHDTGLMHVAAAFNRPMVSVWGNTIPEFGMDPYYSSQKEVPQLISQCSGLSCRPCSKLGSNSCPKKHFHCMELQDENEIADWVNGFSET